MKKGVAWLLESTGAESDWEFVLGGWLRREKRDYRLKSWPWKAGDAGWVEPTSHALVALKQAVLKIPIAKPAEFHERIQSGEAQFLDIRSSDGGWNYGNADILGMDLPGYPETTALALLGLQDARQAQPERGFAFAERQLKATPSPLGSAWLAIAARAHGVLLHEAGNAQSQAGAFRATS